MSAVMTGSLVSLASTLEDWERIKAAKLAAIRKMDEAVRAVEPKLLEEMAKLEAGVMAAQDKGVEPILFIDCNYPGVVYVGTVEDVEWMLEDGCAPHEVSSIPVELNGEEYGEPGCYVWRVQVLDSLKAA